MAFIRKWKTNGDEYAASLHALPPYRAAPPFEIGFAVTLRHAEAGFWIFGAPIVALELSFERTYHRFFAGVLCLCVSGTREVNVRRTES